MTTPDPGLCATCRYARHIRTRTGSTFWHCLRSKLDPRYSKYPALPVRACPGYQEPDSVEPEVRAPGSQT